MPFFKAGMILGHSLKGACTQLGTSTKLDAATAQNAEIKKANCQ